MVDKSAPAGLQIDRPLRAGSAIGADTLHRQSFAKQVTEVLKRVSADAGLVVAIEGAWGCGKTSILALVEDLLNDEKECEQPVIVHFNPWLIGDRDALLRQFIASIAKAVKLTDHAEEGKRVAKELTTYAKAFDVLKLIPGAEPWVSIVKSVMESVGSASDAVFDYKTPDIESRKQDLERALRDFPQRIVVLIDDLDRLYPAEVYEMVRIIKAVGDLPNVGYVLAWDERFISAALANLNVPYAAAYLDKVVQVRLPVPPLSYAQLVSQMNAGFERLPDEAKKEHFPNSTERFGLMFYYGLGELLEHPRDVIRLFDVVMSIEPPLRGEVQLADLIGLAALMTKAPPVFTLLQRMPQAFVGRRPGPDFALEKTSDVIKHYQDERDKAISNCSNAGAVRKLVHWLFPQTAKEEVQAALNRVIFTEGHIAHPDRLSIALQMSTGRGDVSLVAVRRFVFHPDKQEAIAKGLTEKNCISFLSSIVSVIESLAKDVELDSALLVTALARLIEHPTFVKQARMQTDIWQPHAAWLAMKAIQAMGQRVMPQERTAMAEQLIGDAQALTIAVEIAKDSYVEKEQSKKGDSRLRASPESKKALLAKLGDSLQDAAESGELLKKLRPDRILWLASQLMPERCQVLFQAMQHADPSLDSFVQALLAEGVDSVNGQYYAAPKETDWVEKYIAWDKLKRHAENRLKHLSLSYPTRAAWRAVVEERAIYAKDGSAVDC